jgi:hypothetical protein
MSLLKLFVWQDFRPSHPYLEAKGYRCNVAHAIFIAGLSGQIVMPLSLLDLPLIGYS